jgi:ribonuclease HI
MTSIDMYSDGSSLNNPGPSGAGWVFNYNNKDNKLVSVRGQKGYRISTNNRMEIMAFIHGVNDILEKKNDSSDEFKDLNKITVWADSEYLTNAINKNWIEIWRKNNWITVRNSSPVKNKDLWEVVISHIEKLKSMGITLEIFHIPGHKGHEYNEEADSLAQSAAKDHASYLIDEGYENSKRY